MKEAALYNIDKNSLPDLLSRVSKAFRYPAGELISRDFPLLYSPSNFNRLWAVSEGGSLAAHAGYYPTYLKVEGIRLPVAGIGGVFTDPAFEGQGFASKLVEKCAESAQKEGAALAFLWTDKHDFYRRLGFELVGRQWSIFLEKDRIEVLEELSTRGEYVPSKDFDEKVTPAFLQQSYTLFSQYSVGNERTAAEHSTYLSSKGCKVYSAWKEDKLVAYCVIGKGLDLSGYIHEWAGYEKDLLALFAHCLKKENNSLVLLSPQFMPEEVPLIYSLDENAFRLEAGYMAMVKLLDLSKVVKLLHLYMQSLGLKAENLRIEKKGEHYELAWQGNAWVQTLNESQLLRFLFGPEMPAHPALKAFLPMRVWYWGMDSV